MTLPVRLESFGDWSNGPEQAQHLTDAEAVNVIEVSLDKGRMSFGQTAIC